ncbi:hypothetical protein BCR36DRAFT_320308 [Piromyces finnis]|uniref:Conserved oligomeric Golgi complex subunit 7 n=1 Tax=Piromyces finnis TaxID=1754191 RepID=A0A1Y1VI27_9FUNG|nr:hypothetical protein BCR36DRAFT_320308 [Piromyces finnis]|eukprot:ORX56683.1 hypothetical protein BCR36DRAFT_320308 [Piromyces finnis]
MISNNSNNSSSKQKLESIFTNVEKKKSISSLTTPTSVLSPTITGSYNNTIGLDLSELKEKDADVKGWINKMLSSSMPLPNVKSIESSTNINSEISPTFAASPSSTASPTTDNNVPQQSSILLIKLENAGQQISKSIEKISNEVVKNIPRVMYDIENMRKDIRIMQESINHVRMEYRKFNTDSSEVIQPMFLLDTIRLRMEDTRKLLKEAENWSNLSLEMDDIFNNKEYERAAVTLEDAQKSLALLKNSSDYEEKRELLRKYLNRLEAELSPLLLQTIKSKDIKNLKKYQKIFKKIDRESEFYGCYFRNVKQEIIRYWMGFEVKDSEQQEIVVPITPLMPSPNKEDKEDKKEEDDNILIINSTNPHNLSFVEWIPSYFDELYSIIVKEFNWSANIFKQPGDVVCHLINESNKHLKPSFSQRLESFKSSDGSHFVISLINIYKVVENFAQTVEHNILFQRDTSRFLKMSTFAPTCINSSVMSRFNKNYHLGNWGEYLFEPFLPYQQNFANLEYNYLIEQLKNLFKPDVMAHKSPNELVDHLHLSVDKIFNKIEGTIQRCIDLTYGYACPHTLKIINDYLITSLEKYSDILRVIRSRTEIKLISKIKEEHKLGIHSPLASTTSINNSSRSSLESINDADEDLLQERNRQVWFNFQLGFKLLGVCCLFDKEIKRVELQELPQFFEMIFSNRKTLEETNDLLTQLNSILKINHADSEYEIQLDSPVVKKNESKVFNSEGDDIKDNSFGEVIGQEENHEDSNNSNLVQDNAVKLEKEDSEKQQKYLQKAAKELQIFEELYRSQNVGSVISREMIRLSSLNNYELKECIRIITKQYYQTKMDTSTKNSNTNTTESQASAILMDMPELELLPQDKIRSTILNNVKAQMSNITSECQHFIYDAIFLIIDEQLSDLFNKERWSHVTSTKTSPFNFEIPQFSLSPSSYIINIGEHLLSLPQHLELYINDEALTYSVNTLPYCQPMVFLTNSLLEDINITPSKSTEENQHQDDESEFEEPSGHMWIVSLCNGTMNKYIKNIMNIKELTAQESKQLGTDISYLINIFGALEIYVSPILNSINNFSHMNDKELLKRKEELESILNKQLNLNEDNNITENENNENLKEDNGISSSMMLMLTEHEEYELIKLWIKIRNINEI